MDAPTFLAAGQQEARTRWGTHASGAAFDRKKTPYLTEEAQEFIAQQALCVIAGLGPQKELCGMLALGRSGFVETPNSSTCLVHLDSQCKTSRLWQGLCQSRLAGRVDQLGLFFIRHATRERLCVQGTAKLRTDHLDWPAGSDELAQVELHVLQAFFHCAKYIRTRIAGLTTPPIASSQQGWQPQDLLGHSQTYLSEEMQSFITRQALCFLCTVDQHGQCAVNHRGGAPGFLVTILPDGASPGGIVLLPDYAGNGAFEAIGNILETEQAALVVPDYSAQLALCISGPAYMLEVGALSEDLARRCVGAERVVALSVQRVETQSGDWSASLAYERACTASISTTDDSDTVCTI